MILNEKKFSHETMKNNNKNFKKKTNDAIEYQLLQ